MLENLGLFGLFLGCLLSATIIPFSSEALVSGASLLGYNVWVIVIVASIVQMGMAGEIFQGKARKTGKGA